MFDFNLNRQSAIVSAFADGNFDKYEYLTRIDLTRIDLALKPNSLQKARFEHSPLGNLLSKKLKVSGDDDNENDENENENDDSENDDENDVDLLNEMKNHLNSLPRPVLQLPRQQSDLQTQTMPILSTRPVQQSDLKTQAQLPTQVPTQSIRTPFVRPLSPIQTNRRPIKLLSLSPISESQPVALQPSIETIQSPILSQPQQNITKKKRPKDFKLYYQTEPYGVTSQYYIPVGENIVNPRVAYSYPGNIYELGSNKHFTPIDAVDIAHYQDNTGNNQMTYIGNIGDVATALNEVEKQGKCNLTHLFTSPPTQQSSEEQELQPMVQKGEASSLNNPQLQKQMNEQDQELKSVLQKGQASSLNNQQLQKQMKNIVATNEKEELKNKLGSTLNNPVIEARFNKMFDDDLNEVKAPYEKTYALAKPCEQQQQSWQERIKDQAANHQFYHINHQ